MKTDIKKPEARPLAAPPPASGSAFPRALFSCEEQGCSEEFSFHADEIYWIPSEEKWMCWNCTSYHDSPERGISLEEWLMEHRPPLEQIISQNAKMRDRYGEQSKPKE